MMTRFKVLITTRLRLDLPNPINLDILDDTDTLALLRELIGKERTDRELNQGKIPV